MILKDRHHKHPPMVRPSIGSYHSNEWAIYGSTCDNIEQLYRQIEYRLEEYTLTYIDADHHTKTLDTVYRQGKKIYSQSAENPPNEYDDKIGLLQSDAVFINGNHYPATRQIVIIDFDKEDSLRRREDQLTNIDLILIKNQSEKCYDFVRDKAHKDTLILPLEDLSSIVDHLRRRIKERTPRLKALILAGGKSTRMGVDKTNIAYHNNTAHPIHLANICKGLGIDTYISKGYNYKGEEVDGYSVIKDRLVDMGPFGAIISAFIYDPDAAWLVLACDLPFVDSDSIKKLITERDSGKIATTYIGDGNPFPEPLISIYEPSAYKRLLSFMALGYSCPRKVLINSDIKTVTLHDNTIIANANTPDERDHAMEQLKKNL